jgi:hypothetical protein
VPVEATVSYRKDTKPVNDDLRIALYELFGADADALPNLLDSAGRYHRAAADALRTQPPSGLMTPAGTTHLADQRDADADRCERMATIARRTLGHDPATDTGGDDDQ